jgi:hypothetical protein
MSKRKKIEPILLVNTYVYSYQFIIILQNNIKCQWLYFYYFIFGYILGQMAYNVPVINDGLPARISITAGFAGLANCGGVRRGNGVAMT